MREYIRKGFKKEQLSKETKKLTAILQALRNCHKSLSTINGGEEKTLAIHAIAYAFEQVDLLRQMKGKNTARSLPATKTIDVQTFPDTIDVESEVSNLRTLMEVHQPSVLSGVMDEPQ